VDDFVVDRAIEPCIEGNVVVVRGFIA